MEIWIDGNEINIKTPYDADIINKIRTIPGRKWNPLFKMWTVPNNRITTELLSRLGFDISSLIEMINKDNINKQVKFEILREKIKISYPFLYNYQLDAVAKGFINERLLNADEMGLGKTLEAFAAMDRWLNTEKIERVMIFCPSAIKPQWKNEIVKWFGKIAIIIEGKYTNRIKLYNSKQNILILNYEILVDRLDKEGNYKTNDFGYIFNLTENQGMILDEATYVKNPMAKRTQFIRTLKPKYLFALTGTPIENKLADAYNIGNLVHPDWMTKSEFYSYCLFDDKFGSIIGYKNLDLFMNRLMEIGIRRTWEDVGIQMPKQIIEERFFALTKYQDALEKHIIEYLNTQDWEGKNANETLLQFVILPMLEDSTELLNLSEAKSIQGIGKVEIESPKLDYLSNLLDEMSDSKIIIFTRFGRMAHLIFDELSKNQECLIITGKMNPKICEETKQRFKEGKERILISTDKMSRGVDLPFVTACINYDIPWKPSTLFQRIGRCYRANSKYERLLVVNFISEGLEKYIYDVMKGKEALLKMVTDFDLKKQLMTYLKGKINR